MRSPALVLLCLAALAGCAGTRPYASDAPKNLTVHSAVERGVKAQLHIHSVKADCSTEYRGSVALDRPSVELAIPAGGFTYLVVSFDTSSFFGGARSSSPGRELPRRDLVTCGAG